MADKCPDCKGNFEKIIIRREEIYKGKSFELDTILLRCPNCGKEIDTNSKERTKEKKRIELSVDGFLTDKEIKKIRKKLVLTQKAMAEALGVGLKNFARYESSAIRQSRAMDNLLRILNAHPKAIAILEHSRHPFDIKESNKK